VERFFAQITTQRIRRGTFDSVRALETAIDRYLGSSQSAVQTVRLDRDR
jgi:hypothetical protein